MRQRGFTLLELLVVLAIVAMASAGVGFAMRDSGQARLEREAQRLVALLESARARSQALGTPLRWRVTVSGFRFEGATQETAEQALPEQWLDADTRASIEPPGNSVPAATRPSPANADTLLLGPEPIIEPQAVLLSSVSRPQQHVRIATDGLRPFAPQDAQ